MPDDILLKDIDTHLANLASLQKWLKDVYYNPEFANMFNKPVLSMLSTGVDYLIENIMMLRNRYAAKR